MLIENSPLYTKPSQCFDHVYILTMQMNRRKPLNEISFDIDDMPRLSYFFRDCDAKDSPFFWPFIDIQY